MKPPAAIFLVTAVVGALLVAWRYDTAREARRDAAVEASRTRTWARQQAGAGISVLPKRVPSADRRELRGLEELAGFDAYATRCASCHELPDPGAYPPKRWIGKVAEMVRHIERAGVVPPEAQEVEEVVDFLGRAAAELRPADP